MKQFINRPSATGLCSPTSQRAALDGSLRVQFPDLIQKTQKESGTSLILITYDLGVVAEVCDFVMAMFAGRVVETSYVRTLLHPYTKGLIQSTQNHVKGARRLNESQGMSQHRVSFRRAADSPQGVNRQWEICHFTRPLLKQMDHNTACSCYLFETNDESAVDHS